MPNFIQYSRAAALPLPPSPESKSKTAVGRTSWVPSTALRFRTQDFKVESWRAFCHTSLHGTQHSDQFAVAVCTTLLISAAAAPTPRPSGGRDQHPVHQEDTREGVMHLLKNITESNSLISSGESQLLKSQQLGTDSVTKLLLHEWQSHLKVEHFLFLLLPKCHCQSQRTGTRKPCFHWNVPPATTGFLQH